MLGRSRGMMTPASGLSGVSYKPSLEDPWVRFQIELEFVQSLGNPDYLTFLAQQGCFEKPEFIHYLAYLQYWNSPPYSRFIVYPFCLHMLELLQSPNFRREVARDTVTRFIDDQMLLHWQNYIRKRAELIAKHVQVLEAGVPGQSLPSGLGPPPPLGSSSTSGGTGATGGPPFL